MSETSKACCGHCGEWIQNDDAFCSACGTETDGSIQMKRCPNCTNLYEIDEGFCSSDGTALELVTAKSPVAKALPTSASATRKSALKVKVVSSVPPGAQGRTKSKPAIAETFDQKTGAFEKQVETSGSSFGGESLESYTDSVTSNELTFWIKHKVLNIISLCIIVPNIYLISTVDSFDKSPGTLLVMLLIPIGAAWFVALSDSPGVLNGVAKLDGWFLKSKSYLANSDGKIRRWFMYPILWAAEKWVSFANRSPHDHVSASLRLIGYVFAFFVIFMIAYFFVALFVVGVFLAIFIFFADIFTGGNAARGVGKHVAKKGAGMAARKITEMAAQNKGGGRIFGNDATLIGRRGDKLYKGIGGLFGSEELIGRVGDDGKIYEGKGGLFGSEEVIGRIGDDGKIYEGKGGLWGTEDRVGRVDDDGIIHEGSGGLFGNEERQGRIDDECKIYKGKGGLFGSDDRTGRSGDN
jgi:hypothetical protein